MIRKTLYSWKRKKFNLVTIILVIFFCITIISMMVNDIFISAKESKDISMGNVENYTYVTVSSDSREMFKGDAVEIVKAMSKYGKVDMLKLNAESISKGNKHIKCKPYLTIFNKEPDYTAYVSKGRYINAEEASKGGKVALLSYKTLKDLNVFINDYIEFYGEKYKVIGILGPNHVEQDSQWNETVVLPLNSVPKAYLEKLKSELIYSNTGSGCLLMSLIYRVKPADCDNILKIATEKFNKDKIRIASERQKTSFSSGEVQTGISTFILSIPIMLVAIFVIFNMCYFWIEDRKREITIRKVLGATDKSIISLVRRQVISVVLIGSVLSFVFQLTMRGYLDDILAKDSLSLEFNFTNFVLCVILSLFIGYIATIIPAKRVISMDPAEALRYE
ncbi:ABC transporter permease [Inconstantimicrobium mannanitabidum]|nr:ABC transporter permease [Clostridium sp. TW13]